MALEPKPPARVVDFRRWIAQRRRDARHAPEPAPEPEGRTLLVDLLGLDLRRHLGSSPPPGGCRLFEQAREVIEHRLQATLGPLMNSADWDALARSRLSPAEALALLRHSIPHVDAVVTELVDELRRDLDLWLDTVQRGRRPTGPDLPPRDRDPDEN